ncbi:MAG TPA: carbohydrate ABC transporter permease [Chloroflexia bacterium]|nr:carbohydrate ABC transporter permease [Chloroflexia bacterium]
MGQSLKGLRQMQAEQEVPKSRVETPARAIRPWQIIRGGLVYVALLVAAFFALVPFAWMVSTALKPANEVLSTQPNFIPENATLDNFGAIADAFPVGRILFNTALVAALTTGGQLLFCSMSAFAFARIPFKGRNLLFLLYLATLMVPAQVTITPLFILMSKLGWINTYQGLILPGIFTSFGVFLLRQSFLTFPREYEEAASLDGASYWTIYRKLLLPVSSPALATLAVLSFMDAWNAFLWPLFVTRDAEFMTLQVALATLQGRWTTQWNLVMAGSVLAVLPILIIYLFAQRYFVQGMTMSGIKG